jgi:hypothetical protein
MTNLDAFITLVDEYVETTNRLKVSVEVIGGYYT